MKIVILGAGGHAQVVADILLQMGQDGTPVDLLGFLDDAVDLTGKAFLGLPVLGQIAELTKIEHDAVIIGIGNNEIRQRIYAQLNAQNETLSVARHPHSVIAPGVPIGPGSVICAGVVVNTGSRIGTNVILNTGCTIDHHNQIGDHAHVAPGVHLGGDVSIGEGTMIGIGATVLPQTKIGSWTIVGAGSVVTKPLSDSVVAIGVPAQVIRRQSKG